MTLKPTLNCGSVQLQGLLPNFNMISEIKQTPSLKNLMWLGARRRDLDTVVELPYCSTSGSLPVVNLVF